VRYTGSSTASDNSTLYELTITAPSRSAAALRGKASPNLVCPQPAAHSSSEPLQGVSYVEK